MTKDQLIEVISTLQELAFFDPLPALIHKYLTLVGKEACAEDFQKHFNNFEEIQTMIRTQYFYMFNEKLDDTPFTARIKDFLDYGALVFSSSTTFLGSGEKANLGLSTKEKVVTLNTMPLEELDLDGIERFFNDGTYTKLHLSGLFKNVKSSAGEVSLKLLKTLTINILPSTSTSYFENFPELPHIKELHIKACKKIKQEDFFENFFKRFPNLQKLHLHFYNNACKVPLDAFKPLARLKELTLISITSNFPTLFWKHLPELTKITVSLQADEGYIKKLFNKKNMPPTLRKVICNITPLESSKDWLDGIVEEPQGSNSLFICAYKKQIKRKLRTLLPDHVASTIYFD